ncbi:tRNA (guanosine(37)-N1)-methyltransferase TrmD [Carnimonas nigrificans]|uniref:tRNA (guanosine(37)-N1)-methyltransferase TrmD n=1 Tax=Carnimonas nigrificans TaxID=64323 RepID=UPI000472A78D|nr:tRNA (guanosine(37)-N1)-methyltransferase TrmD [Carnimonas nigrificans]
MTTDTPQCQPGLSIGIVSLFPEMFPALTEQGVIGRAVKQGLLDIRCWNPRDYAQDRHRTVDDRPYGGGPGMLMKVDTLRAAIRDAREALTENGQPPKVIYLSPQGRVFSQQGAVELVARQRLVLVAGRYEGIDERVIESDIDEQWSIGDYVLSGGELPAMVMIDALSRLVPGVLGHERSAVEDSFSDGLLDCPHYTRPEEVDGKRVPAVLLGGNHGEIRRWRLKQSLGRTMLHRPELLDARTLSKEEQQLLDAFVSEYGAGETDSSSDGGA